MNNFFVSFVFIFVSCIYINMILFNYIKEYLDNNNETLESCIRGLETKINDSDSILKEVEKKSTTFSEKIESQEKAISSALEKNESGIQMLKEELTGLNKELEENITKNWEDLQKNQDEDITKKISMEIKKNTVTQNRVSDFSLLKKIKNTKLINIDNGKSVKEETDTHTAKMIIKLQEGETLNITSTLKFNIINLFWVSGYISDTKSRRVVKMLPVDVFTFPSTNTVQIKSDSHTIGPAQELCLLINGIFDKYTL